MTTPDEFERQVAGFLEDGPRQAPDRPIELALVHARRHPRRRDLLGWLRPDPMGGRANPSGLRPVWQMAVVGLLLAAVLGVSVVGVGSWLNSRAPQIAPSIQPSLAPSGPVASVAPSPVVSPSPTPATFNVTFRDDLGRNVAIGVIDGSNLVTNAAPGKPADAGESGPGGVALSNGTGDGTLLHVAWVGCPSQTSYRVTIDAAARSMRVETEPCQGDTLGVERAIDLKFSRPVRAADIEAVLDQTGS